MCATGVWGVKAYSKWDRDVRNSKILEFKKENRWCYVSASE